MMAARSKRPLSLRWRYLGFVGGATIAAIGLGVLSAALIGSDPGRTASEAVEAKATIIAQSAMANAPDGQHPNRFSGPSKVGPPASYYYETFSYTDSDGHARDGYDEVSAEFYATHGVDAAASAYYYPEAPERAVLGTPLRLGVRGYRYGMPIAGVLLMAAFFLMVLNFEPVLSGMRRLRAARQRPSVLPQVNRRRGSNDARG